MYKVKLSSFEGPFDLLVYLIESARMSIYDIRISEITSEYLAVLKELEENDIAVSEEFMVLAASLIEIKSKMLLPKEEDDEEEMDSDIWEPVSLMTLSYLLPRFSGHYWVSALH